MTQRELVQHAIDNGYKLPAHIKLKNKNDGSVIQGVFEKFKQRERFSLDIKGKNFSIQFIKNNEFLFDIIHCNEISQPEKNVNI